MYEQFTTILLLTVTVAAQEVDHSKMNMGGAVEQDNGEAVEGGEIPQPQWLMHDDYVLMATLDDFGTFVNNVECASFAIWDDSENSDLKQWVQNMDFEAVMFTEPTGMVFGGVMDFLVSPIDFGLDYSVCFFQDGWEEARCAAAQDNLALFSTGTIPAEAIPEAGELVDAGSLLVTAQKGQAPGIENIFGQKFEAELEEWFIWMWNTQTNYNWEGGDYDAFVI